MVNWKESYRLLADRLDDQGIDVVGVEASLKMQKIETPSWGYGNSGTRFQVFEDPAAARNIHEKIDDAAVVHKLSGIAPSIAIHIPWDMTDDWKALSDYSKSKGIRIGAVNPNVFQESDYKLGSVCHPDASVRKRAVSHMSDCCHIMKETGSKVLSVWLADGTNYAGQDDIRRRRAYLLESLHEVYKALPIDSRILLEYKPFEPAFYHTDIADWGTAFTLCQKLGPQAEVLVDTGHHAPGTNIAYIVAQLLDENRLGGFHFNARQYADDDLIVGSCNSWELFVIFTELIQAGKLAEKVEYMIDQSHNIEPKLEAMLQSVLNCQIAYVKGLIVDYKLLQELQSQGDVLGAHRVLKDAFETDVRPMLAKVREEMNCPIDPIAELRSGTFVKDRESSRSGPA